MRKVVLWSAAAVMLLLVVGAMSHVPPTAADQRPLAAAGVDVGAMSRAMDMNALPRQELSPDIYR